MYTYYGDNRDQKNGPIPTVMVDLLDKFSFIIMGNAFIYK